MRYKIDSNDVCMALLAVGVVIFNIWALIRALDIVG